MSIIYSVNNMQIEIPYYKEMERLAVEFFEEEISRKKDGGKIQDINQLACFVYFIGKCSDEFLRILIDVVNRAEKSGGTIE